MILLTVNFFACAANVNDLNYQDLIHDASKPSLEVSLFAKNLISTPHNERDIAISPDGEQIFFTRVTAKNTFSAIMFIEKNSTSWSEPKIASFSGKYSDMEPAFSPDGKRLYFASNRAIDGVSQPKDYDIWYVEKTGDTWSQAKNLDSIINTELNEFYPSITSKGDIYFTGLYDQNESGENIYKSAFINGKYQQPIAINEAGSATANEFNAYVSADESYIIFSSDRKKERGDYADMYISFNENGYWTNAINLGDAVNASQLDYCPLVYQGVNGRILFFTRTDNTIKKYYPNGLSNNDFSKLLNSIENGSGNIYSTNFDLLLEQLQAN